MIVVRARQPRRALNRKRSEVIMSLLSQPGTRLLLTVDAARDKTTARVLIAPSPLWASPFSPHGARAGWD